MDFSRPVEDLSRSTPDHGQPGGAGMLFKPSDVVYQHLGVVHLRAFWLEVGAVDTLHIFSIENRRHRLNFLEWTAQAFYQRLVQDAGMQCGFVAVLIKNIPA